MKIQLLSDLHLETQPGFVPTPAPDADVLVLAGDIGSYQPGSALPALGDRDFGLARFSPRHGWPVPVLFVPGNHEYDGLDFDAAHTRLRESCERLGITWLEREVVVLDGVRFVGTTLWSDFDALGPLAGRMPTVPPPAHAVPSGYTLQLAAREKAFRAANHYLRKTGTVRRGQAWLAESVREQALVCQQWLADTLGAAPATPAATDTPAGTAAHPRTVVVTHFAPSLRSADPRYGLTPGTAGFCNALDALLPQAQLWLHGHLHCPSDYVDQGCRVVANPLGYAGKGEQSRFVPTLTLDI